MTRFLLLDLQLIRMGQIMKIRIRKSSDADSRSAKGELDKWKLKGATLQHKEDVRAGIRFLVHELIDKGISHDWSKLSYLDEFWEEYSQHLSEEEFKNGKFYPIHVNKERHHLNSNCPEDVNLLDVLELIVDCIMAGKGRFGTCDMKYFELPDYLLNKAYWNTVKLLDEAVEVME